MAISAGGIAKRHSFIVASEPLQVVIFLGLVAAIFCFFFKKKVPAAQTQAKATQQPVEQNDSDPNSVALQRKSDEVQALEAKAPPQLSPHQSLVASSAPDAHKYPMSKVFSPQMGCPGSGIIAQESRRTSNARQDSCASNTTVEAMMTVEHSPRGPARTIGLGRLSYTSSQIGTAEEADVSASASAADFRDYSPYNPRGKPNNPQTHADDGRSLYSSATYSTSNLQNGPQNGGKSSPYMFKTMTPRTEVRRHMQGKSSATQQHKQRSLPHASPGPAYSSTRGGSLPNAATNHTATAYNTATPSSAAYASTTPAGADAWATKEMDFHIQVTQERDRDTEGEREGAVEGNNRPTSDLTAGRAVSPAPGAVAERNRLLTLMGFPSKRKETAAAARGTWVASSAGGPRMNYEDSHKKSGFLTGVESRVTAMRGAAGWRRQLELASSRVAGSRDPSPDARSRSPRAAESMGAWMIHIDSAPGGSQGPDLMSMSSWMSPGGPPLTPPTDDFGGVPLKDIFDRGALLAPPIDFLGSANNPGDPTRSFAW